MGTWYHGGRITIATDWVCHDHVVGGQATKQTWQPQQGICMSFWNSGSALRQCCIHNQFCTAIFIMLNLTVLVLVYMNHSTNSFIVH
jgi:hypothetical protein